MTMPTGPRSRYATPEPALVGELAIRVYDRGPEPDWHTDRTLFGPWLPFEAELVGHEGSPATGWSPWEAIYGVVAAHRRDLDGLKGRSVMRLVRRWGPRRRETAVPLTGGELLARLGRLLLWAAVAVVLVRGLGDILASPGSTPTVRAREQTGDVWPDDAARAFAVEFATAYLDHPPQDDSGEYARRIAGFASTQVARELAPQLDQRRSGQTVRSAAVAGSITLDAQHALLTVAATVTTPDGVTTRHLTVPVARDDDGGLVVYDLPSFAAASPRASAGPTEGEPLIGDERAAVADVVGRFMRAYLAGDSGGLSYLVPPGHGSRRSRAGSS